MSLRAHKNKRAFQSAQQAWDNATPPDDEPEEKEEADYEPDERSEQEDYEDFMRGPGRNLP